MRKLFIISTTLFWFAVAGFWIANYFHSPVQTPEVTSTAVENNNKYSLAEVKLHNQTNSCWMVIEGQVYDITSYLPAHPSAPEILLTWCGREASLAWQTKTIGRPHSSRAQHLLSKYFIGKVQKTQ